MVYICGYKWTSLMVHIFMLVVILGTGEFRKELPNPMYFYDINKCLYFAKKIPTQYGNYGLSMYIDPKDRITAYCKPIYSQDFEGIYE